MDELTYAKMLICAMPALGYVVARCRYRARILEMHRVHELCQDAAYAAGLDRGREERQVTIGTGDAWYSKGFNDGLRKGLRKGRQEAEERLSALGLGKQ